MNNKKILFCSLMLFSFSFSTEWFYYSNNPWSINTSSRSSSIGGICVENHFHSIKKDFSNKISIFNSNMFGGLIHYNNIFINHKINNGVFFDNLIDGIQIRILNRKINSIPKTQYAWDEIAFNEPSLSNINYNLIDYFSHKDIGLLIAIPFSNKYGDFLFSFKTSYTKIDNYDSSYFGFDGVYSKYYSDRFYFSLILNNLFSYKKWSTEYIEKFYPSISLLFNYRINKASFFYQIDNVYFEKEYLKSISNILDLMKLGLEYSIYDNFDVRIGYNKNFQTVGLGIEVQNILFDYTYLYHQYLDYSHQFTISFLIKNK